MKVWIDQDLCTGDGLCEEIAPDVFTLLDDGLAYVKEGAKIYAEAKGNPQGAAGMTTPNSGASTSSARMSCTIWRYRGSNTCNGSTAPGSNAIPSGNIGMTPIRRS